MEKTDCPEMLFIEIKVSTTLSFAELIKSEYKG